MSKTNPINSLKAIALRLKKAIFPKLSKGVIMTARLIINKITMW